jgi:hypothetical protein
MQPFAIAYAFQLCSNGSATQVTISMTLVAGDGVNPAQQLVALGYTYDLTQPVATNLANIKAAVTAQVESEAGINVSSDNVTLLLAVN